MRYWIITFFALAIIAAILGFGGATGAATDVARVLFFVFLAGLVMAGAFRALDERAQ